MTPLQTLIEIKAIVEQLALQSMTYDNVPEKDAYASNIFNHSDDAYQGGLEDGATELAQGLMSIIKKFENDTTTKT